MVDVVLVRSKNTESGATPVNLLGIVPIEGSVTAAADPATVFVVQPAISPPALLQLLIVSDTENGTAIVKPEAVALTIVNTPL